MALQNYTKERGVPATNPARRNTLCICSSSTGITVVGALYCSAVRHRLVLVRLECALPPYVLVGKVFKSRLAKARRYQANCDLMVCHLEESQNL